MNIYKALLAGLMVGTLFTDQPALAQDALLVTIPCADSTGMEKTLQDDYHQKAVGTGLAYDGSLIRVWTSPDRKFTVTVTKKGGVTCVLAMGHVFKVQPLPVPGTAL